MTGKGHPLPRSDEARHDQIPEHLERDKGRGDDAEASAQPAVAVTPEGEAYPSGAPKRGPAAPTPADKKAGSG